MNLPEPTPQHQWLGQLIGEWTFESSCPVPPGETPQTFKGSESARMLGDLWMVAEGRGEMPGGGEHKMLMTLGYNPQSGRFVGTWIGSMMTHLWVYDGKLDAGQRVLSLHADGPAMDQQGNPTGGLAKYKDVIEIISPEERTLTGHLMTDDGNWMPIMTARYHRLSR